MRMGYDDFVQAFRQWQVRGLPPFFLASSLLLSILSAFLLMSSSFHARCMLTLARAKQGYSMRASGQWQVGRFVRFW